MRLPFHVWARLGLMTVPPRPSWSCPGSSQVTPDALGLFQVLLGSFQHL